MPFISADFVHVIMLGRFRGWRSCFLKSLQAVMNVIVSA